MFGQPDRWVEMTLSPGYRRRRVTVTLPVWDRRWPPVPDGLWDWRRCGSRRWVRPVATEGGWRLDPVMRTRGIPKAPELIVLLALTDAGWAEAESQRAASYAAVVEAARVPSG